MEKRKGVDLLLKAYPHYRQLGGTKPLILAGKMQEEDIRQLLENTMHTTEGIKYLDYVTHEKKHQLFADCSCFVFPSKAEGFGMPVIEAMKFKKPILISNLDIYDELIGPCVNEFDLNATENVQIDNLAHAMLDFKTEVDVDRYEEVVDRYSPAKLGNIVRQFINSQNYGG